VRDQWANAVRLGEERTLCGTRSVGVLSKVFGHIGMVRARLGAMVYRHVVSVAAASGCGQMTWSA
jgi:hypothetical protein